LGVDGCSETDLSKSFIIEERLPAAQRRCLGGEKPVCEALEAGADGYLLKEEITTEALLPRRLTQLLRVESGMLLDVSPKADDLRLLR
jgi:hypothetical protein